MLAKLKRKIKADLALAAICAGLILFVCLILGSVAFEIFKVIAVIKYVFS